MKLWQLSKEDSNKLAEQLVDTHGAAHVVCNTRGMMILVNELAEAMFGYTHAELIGERVELLVPDEFKEVHVQHRNKLTKCPMRRQAVCVNGRHKSGRLFPVQIALRPIILANEVFVAAIIDRG